MEDLYIMCVPFPLFMYYTHRTQKIRLSLSLLSLREDLSASLGTCHGCRSMTALNYRTQVKTKRAGKIKYKRSETRNSAAPNGAVPEQERELELYITPFPQSAVSILTCVFSSNTIRVAQFFVQRSKTHFFLFIWEESKRAANFLKIFGFRSSESLKWRRD